jgi:hypothetical protein
MASPKEGYYIDGRRIPAVTSILSRFKESGGLIHWAWRIPYEGLAEARALLEDSYNGAWRMAQAEKFLNRPLAEFDYKAQRQKAADAGTIAHEMVDCFIHSRSFNYSRYDPELIEIASSAYKAFLTWAEQARLKVIETEKPLISHKYQFGGTRDGIVIDQKRALCDWKTSNGIYVDYLLQLAAYGILDEEHGNKIDGGYHLFRFSKQEKPSDPVHFTHHYWSQLDQARDAFLLMRGLYDLMADLKKLAT